MHQAGPFISYDPLPYLTGKSKDDAVPSLLITEDGTCLVAVGPDGFPLTSRDYSSVVFDDVPQDQLPTSVLKSNVTVTIFGENEREFEENLDETVTPTDFAGDEDTRSGCVSPVLCE